MIYDDLGVPRIINAYGTNTRLSGGLMAPEVLSAMAEAARATVEMHHLQAAASREIAKATGAEAGIVTSGASAAVLLGAAACMARLDPGAMPRPGKLLMRSRIARRRFTIWRARKANRHCPMWCAWPARGTSQCWWMRRRNCRPRKT
jgi:hypothetical protein